LCGRTHLLIALTVSLGAAPTFAVDTVTNPTGLPTYPNLNHAQMDRVARTDKLGHWCNRFSADTSDALEVVEAWYRKALVSPSETELNNDETYKNYVRLTGVKLAVGIDYVTVFRTADQSTTSIELFRCSPVT
jgi:hypothetical protein